jgi:hypothetical protein
LSTGKTVDFKGKILAAQKLGKERFSTLLPARITKIHLCWLAKGRFIPLFTLSVEKGVNNVPQQHPSC